MHRHDLDLIAEYAGGLLEEETVARNLVETCNVCRAEYESQMSVLGALAGMESLAMTDQEKAVLHRDLWTDLRRPATTPTAARRPWATWAAGVTAVLLLSVGLVGVLNQLGGGDTTAETFSEVGSSLDNGFSGEGREETTRAATDGLAGAPSEGLGYFYDSTTDFASVAEQILADPKRFSDAATFSSAEEECLESTALVGFSLVSDNRDLTWLLVAIADDSDDETPAVAFIDPETCEVIHLEE